MMVALEQYINPEIRKHPKKPSYSELVLTQSGASGRYTRSRDDFVSIFYRSLSKWNSETAFSSSLNCILENEGYRAIVGLGEPAIDLILLQLHEEPSLLVYALEDILGEKPYTEDSVGNIKEMTDAWLNWGRNR